MVRFTKLLDGEVNIGEWTRSIIEQCNFGSFMLVDLGLSFTAKKKLDSKVSYMYCPKSAASFSEKFETRKEALDWCDSLTSFKNMNEFLSLSFLQADFGEFFRESGWSTRSPIALHLWIQK